MKDWSFFNLLEAYKHDILEIKLIWCIYILYISHIMIINKNHMGSVMVNMFILSVVDRGLNPILSVVDRGLSPILSVVDRGLSPCLVNPKTL